MVHKSNYDNAPYRHHVVIHNGQSFYDLLGPESKYSGLSLQTNKADFRNVYPSISKWKQLAKQNQVKWAVAIDEPGDAQHSLVPDEDNPEHNNARQNALWGSFMAGSWGIEWYFGYKHAHSDLSCQDWRSRDKMWDQSRYALDFFRKTKLPVSQMEAKNELTADENDWVLAGVGKYLVLRKMGDKQKGMIKLEKAGKYKARWYNPRTGKFAAEYDGSTGKDNMFSVGVPPTEVEMDWVLLIE